MCVWAGTPNLQRVTSWRSIPDDVRRELERADPGARVAVGLSGGVDSAVTAVLLASAGFRVIGLTMRVWDGSIPLPATGRSGCYGPGEEREVERLRGLAARLGIPFHEIPLAPDYRREVLDYVREEYRRGRTPNPCAWCNRRVKLGRLVEAARAAGLEFDWLATGHYARLRPNGKSGRVRLYRALDDAKDQSYFLALTSPAQLQQLLLPLGSLTKPRVREMAAAAGLNDFVRLAESQDFLEAGTYTTLFDATDQRPGDLVDEEGRPLGRHRGLIHYTVGQRRGLGIGGAAEPWYVVRIEPAANRLVVGRRADALSGRLLACGANWIPWPEPPAKEFRAACRIRQRHVPAAARIHVEMPDRFIVEFDEPQFAITPGQVAAIYDGDELLGAGIIESASSDGTPD